MSEIQLNIEQQAALDNLLAGDAEAEAKFEMSADIQKHILGMILTDEQFMIQSSGLVKSVYFVNIAHQHIHRISTAYFDRYRTMPHIFYIQEELSRKSKDEAQKLYFLGELSSIKDYFVPGVQHRDYLIEEITDFAKTEAMRVAFKKCTELILNRTGESRRDTWIEVGEILKTAQTVEQNFNEGLDYFQTAEERYHRTQEELETTERFTCGFDSVDEKITGGGLSGGEIGAWISLPGTGKSLGLTKGAVCNVKRNKKVLFVSLEMAEDKVAARFDAQFVKHNIRTLVDDKETVINALKDFTTDYEDKRRLIIKQFPPGQIDVNSLRAYCYQLKLRGFSPDLLIVDYIGEMKDLPGMPVHESREHLIKQLRAFGVEEGHCTLTAIQPNRSAKAAQEGGPKGLGYIDDGSIGDSYNQFRPLDAFWSINQTQEEKELGVGRIFVIKHRDGESRFSIKLGYDYGPDWCRIDGVGSLDMFEVTDDFYKQKMNERRNNDAESTKIDKISATKIKPQNTEQAINDVMGNNL